MATEPGLYLHLRIAERLTPAGTVISTDTETPAGSVPALHSSHREAQATAHPSPWVGEELGEGAPVEPGSLEWSVQPVPNSSWQVWGAARTHVASPPAQKEGPWGSQVRWAGARGRG